MKGATQRGFENFSKNNIPAGPFFANKHFLRHYGSKTDKSLINMRDRTFKAKNVKNLDVLVHELGHARHEASINRGALRSALSSAAIAAKKYKLGTIGGAAMLTNEHTRDKAWVAPILQQARTLHREGMANYYGHKMLSKAGTPAMTKAFRRLAAKNMLGYSGATAAHSALLYAVGRLGKKHDK